MQNCHNTGRFRSNVTRRLRAALVKLLSKRPGVRHLSEIKKRICSICSNNIVYKRFIRSASAALAACRRIGKVPLYIAAVILMGIVIYGSVLTLDITPASSAVINGAVVGVISDRAAFERLYDGVYNELKNSLGDGGTTVGDKKDVTFTPCLALKGGVTDEDSLRQNILSVYDGVASAYAVYADNRLICSAFDKAEIDAALNALLASNGDNSEFVEKIDIRKEYVTINTLCFGENIKKELVSTKLTDAEYTVKDSETLWEIAGRFNMSLDDIEALNPGISADKIAGKTIKIKKLTPLISVRTKTHFDGEVAVAAVTETVYDDTLEKGKTAVVTKGADGLKHVVRDIVSVNGAEVSSVLISENIIKEPVNEVIRVGTRQSDKGTGTFIRPAYGTLSSRYGTRWNRQHCGIDISAEVGAPIYAADNGKVVYSEWESGYGNIIKLDHGNGYETYYAHCSELLKAVGSTVEKGELIARVGNTGNSTGPHLHFEVRLNGVPQNPLQYVNEK